MTICVFSFSIPGQNVKLYYDSNLSQRSLKVFVALEGRFCKHKVSYEWTRSLRANFYIQSYRDLIENPDWPASVHEIHVL